MQCPPSQPGNAAERQLERSHTAVCSADPSRAHRAYCAHVLLRCPAHAQQTWHARGALVL